MYIVYHIPQRKEWGCTKDLKDRLKNSIYDIKDVDKVILVDDMDEAAELEKSLNLEYGYGWNSSRDYRLMVKRAKLSNKIQSDKKLEACKARGTVQGNINVQNGQLAKYCAIGGLNSKLNRQNNAELMEKHIADSALGGYTQSKLEHTCPHCNKTGKSNAMFRHHFTNCKYKK
jgi:hypothetical protein